MFGAKTLVVIAVFFTLLFPARAVADVVTPTTPPERVSFLVTFGDEKCPEAAGDEIVVCAPAPESDRYRIPKGLRKDEAEAVSGGSSWTSAVESLDNYSRALLPNSCSVNGSNGFTGCTQKLLQQWFAERRGKLESN